MHAQVDSAAVRGALEPRMGLPALLRAIVGDLDHHLLLWLAQVPPPP